jgi:very-short-patch-repair endonuclease
MTATTRVRKVATLIPQVTAMDTLCGQLRLRGLPLPEREAKFHPKRRWRLDAAYRLLGLAIEIEGGVWINGRHTRTSGYLGDIEKYNALAELGWRLLRFTPQMVEQEVAVEQIARVISGHLGLSAH